MVNALTKESKENSRTLYLERAYFGNEVKIKYGQFIEKAKVVFTLANLQSKAEQYKTM